MSDTGPGRAPLSAEDVRGILMGLALNQMKLAAWLSNLNGRTTFEEPDDKLKAYNDLGERIDKAFYDAKKLFDDAFSEPA